MNNIELRAVSPCQHEEDDVKIITPEEFDAAPIGETWRVSAGGADTWNAQYLVKASPDIAVETRQHGDIIVAGPPDVNSEECYYMRDDRFGFVQWLLVPIGPRGPYIPTPNALPDGCPSVG